MNYKRYCKLVCFIHLLIAWSNAITSSQLLVNMIQQYSEIEIGNRELVNKAWCLIIFQFIFGCYYYAPFNFCSFKILFAYFGNCYWIHIRMFISQFFFKKKIAQCSTQYPFICCITSNYANSIEETTTQL